MAKDHTKTVQIRKVDKAGGKIEPIELELV